MKGVIEFGCGCRSDRESSVYRKTGNTHGKTGYYCEDHDVFWTYKISYCGECGMELKTLAGPGTPREYCDTCQKRKARARTKAYNEAVSLLKKGEKVPVTTKRRVVKKPIGVSSVEEAEKNKVKCIPLHWLFEFNRKNFEIFLGP